MTPILESILSALAALGDDPAAGLRERGIKGVQDDCYACPVAVYLARALGVQRDTLSVGTGHVALLHGAGVTQCVGLPHAVQRFVIGFDFNQYPDLVA